MISVKRNGFFLEEQVLYNAIWIRHNIPLERLPKLWVCGDSFNLQHAVSCPKGGAVITRYNTLKY